MQYPFHFRRNSLFNHRFNTHPNPLCLHLRPYKYLNTFLDGEWLDLDLLCPVRRRTCHPTYPVTIRTLIPAEYSEVFSQHLFHKVSSFRICRFHRSIPSIPTWVRIDLASTLYHLWITCRSRTDGNPFSPCPYPLPRITDIKLL